MKLVYLSQDDTTFALSKPAGIHSVAQRGRENLSIASLLLAEDPHLAAVSDRPEDAGLINRLDFDTSGILIGARTKERWLTLRAALQGGEIKKSYHALVEGHLIESREAESWIGSPHRGAKKMRSYPRPPSARDRALPAHTTFVPVKELPEQNATLTLVYCPTARRHQIRVHAALLGHPLIGDALYGSQRSLAQLFPDLGERMFYLHASAVQGAGLAINDPPQCF